MNEKLMTEMKSKRDLLRSEDKSLRAMFDEAKSNGATNEDLSKVVAHIKDVDNQFLEVDSDIKQYDAAFKELGNSEDFKKFETELASKYGVEIIAEKLPEDKKEGSKAEEETTVNNKKHTATKVIAGVLALAAAAGLGYGLRGCSASKTSDDTAIYQSEDEEEEKPFETYGQFTDVNDDEQVEARAQWYYDTYIAQSDKSPAGARDLTVDVIANDIRLMNGAFMEDASGNPTYNDTDVITVANDIHTIANYDSFQQYGNDIFFTPTAPLFADGSLAQKGALDLDSAMADVVSAIQKEDNEAFLTAAKNWGTVVINMFDYVDANGEYVSIRQVDPASAFQLYHAMSSKYASTILEYSEKNDINVCVDYCIDYNTHEIKTEALSQIMYNINERAIDAVAVRSGNFAEYEENNISLPQDLCLLAKDYYNSKYDQEIGQSRVLK